MGCKIIGMNMVWRAAGMDMVQSAIRMKKLLKAAQVKAPRKATRITMVVCGPLEARCVGGSNSNQVYH